MAEINMKLEEWQELQDKRRTAENRVVELEAQLANAAVAVDPTGTITALEKLTRALLDVTRFAVGNLPPESIKGWPTKALHTIVDLMPSIPHKTPDDPDLRGELKAFARECEQHEHRRALGPKLFETP